MIGQMLGPYRVLEKLGAGGMGEVYKARDARLDRDVAIKVLPDEVATDADRLRRFEREARAIAALSHPNILAVYDVGLSPVAYVVTELLEGQTLRQRLARGALPVRKAIDYGRQIADGLAAAHDNGIVHRDIKPDNLFLTRDERVKLLDFGLARQEASGAGALAGAGASGSDDAAAGQASTMTVLTDPHVAVGTVGYMAPEQVRAQAVDHRADLFAFGATLYEMLTGRRAFAGATPPDTLSAILSQDPPPLIAPDGAALPPAIERIVIRCLEKDPAARFQSTRDLAFALKTLTPPSSSSSATAPPTVAARCSWRRLMLTIALAGAVLGGVGLGFLTGRSTAPEGARLTYERLTFRQGPIMSARFGPDGKTVFYGAAWEGSPFRIYQTRPEGGELALPIENADLLSVSRDGQLAVLLLKRFGPNAWWKTGTLAVVPVLGAAARELAEDVRAADWAPDGKTLAVVREVEGVSRLEFPLGQVLHKRSSGYIFSPRVSPSGARVAFFEGDPVGGWSVSIIDRSGHRSVLSDGWGDFWDIVWSPDDREVWFAGTKPCAGTQATLYAVDMQGRRRVLAEAPGTLEIHDVTRDGRALAGQVSVGHGTRAWGPDGPAERNLSWLEYSWPVDLSPDGRFVLLNTLSKCTAGSEASHASFLRPVDGAAPIRVADNLLDGRFSPHQRSLLFSEPRRIRVLPIGAGTPHTLDLSFATPTALGAQGWMPDGDRIVVAAVEGAGKMTLRVLAARTGQQQSASVAFVPDVGALISNWLSPVSPDGRVVAVKTGDGRVLVVPLDGSAPHPVPNSDANELPVQWSDDSRSLFVFRPGEVPTRVFRVEVSTGQRTLWREIRPPDVSATGVGGLYLTRDGRSGVYGYAHALVDLYIVNGLR